MLIKSKSFYFIRHGETEWNLQGKLTGQIDIPLTKQGELQAAESVQWLKNKGIQRIVSSPLQRAVQTATIINKVLQVPFELNHDLKELNLGIWQSAQGEYMTLGDATDEGCLIEGVETKEDFLTRIIYGLNDVLSYPQETLIVSHGGVGKMIAAYMGYDLRMKNCVPYLFEAPKMSEGSWNICPLFDTSPK